MRYYRIVLLLGALLSACKPVAETSGEKAAPPASVAEADQAEPYDLRGEWGISRLDGKTLEHRIALTGSSGALGWEPGCALRHIFYRTDGSEILFEKERFDEPQILCDIGYPADLPRVLKALEGRWDAEKDETGSIILTRNGETITLERLPVITIENLAGEWRVAGIDGQGLNERTGLALSADESEIWWGPRCTGAIVPYRIVNERFIQVEVPEAVPHPPGATPPPPPPVCTITIPRRLADAMNAIRAADRIDRTRNGGVRLSGNGRSITLFSQ